MEGFKRNDHADGGSSSNDTGYKTRKEAIKESSYRIAANVTIILINDDDVRSKKLMKKKRT